MPVAWTGFRYSLVVQVLPACTGPATLLCVGDAPHWQLLDGWRVSFWLALITLGSAVKLRSSKIVPEPTPLAVEETHGSTLCQNKHHSCMKRLLHKRFF